MDSSPLSKLPAELCNRIYRRVLLDEAPVKIQRKGVHERTALLRTCSQIRNEATGVFYGNTFHIICGSGNGKVSAEWLKTFESCLHGATKIMITFNESVNLTRRLKAAENVVERYHENKRNDWRTEADFTFYRAAFAQAVRLLIDESLDLANALSLRVRSGTISQRQLNVVNPMAGRKIINSRVAYGQPRPAEERVDLLLMYWLFKGLARPEGDQRRTMASRGGCGPGSVVDRFLSMGWS